MYYIIQENTFNEKGHDRLLKALDRFDLPYEIIKVKPFIEELEFSTDRKDVFCFGGTKMARLAHKYNWNPGVILTENHNFIKQIDHYGKHMLNYDSEIFQFSDGFNWKRDRYFIRPCTDDKAFNGEVFDFEDWHGFWNGAQDCNYAGHGTLCASTMIQVASVKRIQKEYRFWIIDGQVVTGSQYKLGRRTVYDSNIDPEAIEFCKNMVNRYQLAKAFVIDICLCDDKWKIVECGCINSAGFYEADMQKIVLMLEYTLTGA